jgi:hypothetical protein
MKKQGKKQPVKTNNLKNWYPTLTRIVWDIVTHFETILDWFD